MKYLHLGEGFKLPIDDFVESATGLIAKRGKGKSGLVRVVCEELCKAGKPFIAFDPVGILWGLRSSFDGKKPSGYELLVVGGEHGDLPMERKAGKEVARAIGSTNTSVILDFKGMPKAAYREFVTDFANELMLVNKVPRLLVIEEASRVVPQKVMRDTAQAYAAVEQLVTMGRNMGLGCLLVSQRAATINKDVLTQVDHLIVMGITGPQDRKAVQAWVEENAEPERLQEFLEGLSSLKPREAWVWSPELDVFKPFKTRDFTTFHPDRTHLRKQNLLETKPIETDVSKLVENLSVTMKTVAEQAKENDPALLKKRIRDLEAQIASARTEVQTRVEKVVERVEVPVFTDKDKELIEKWVNEARKSTNFLFDATANLKWAPHAEAQGKIPERKKEVFRVAVPKKHTLPGVTPRTPANGTLSGLQQDILDAIAEYEVLGNASPTRQQVALFVGRSANTGHFNNTISMLKTGGYIDYPTPGTVALTVHGKAQAKPVVEPATAVEVQQRVIDNIPSRVGRLGLEILEVLIKNYPTSLSREELGDAVGRSSGTGHFNNTISSLSTFGVVEYPEPGKVRASPILFLEG